MKPEQYVSDKDEVQAILVRITELGEAIQRGAQPGASGVLRLLGRLAFLTIKLAIGIDRNGHSVPSDFGLGLIVVHYLLRFVTILLVIVAILSVAAVPLLFINPLAAGAFLLVDLGLVGVIMVVFVLCFFCVGGGPGRGVRRGRFLLELGGALGRFAGTEPDRSRIA